MKVIVSRRLALRALGRDLGLWGDLSAGSPGLCPPWIGLCSPIRGVPCLFICGAAEIATLTTPIVDLCVNRGKPLPGSGRWEKTILQSGYPTSNPKFRHHGLHVLLSGTMPRGGTLAVDDSHNGRRVSSKDIVACGKWMLSPGYRREPGALRTRRSVGSPGALARVCGSEGTKISSRGGNSIEVSMDVPDEHT